MALGASLWSLYSAAMMNATKQDSRLLARISPVANYVNMAMQRSLNESRIAQVKDGGAGMAQIFNPEGNPDMVCRLAFAVRWCDENPDWTFVDLSK